MEQEKATITNNLNKKQKIFLYVNIIYFLIIIFIYILYIYI